MDRCGWRKERRAGKSRERKQENEMEKKERRAGRAEAADKNVDPITRLCVSEAGEVKAQERGA
ncbi:ATP-dependent rRNA helicase spb4 [Clarias magur]|uniref:ATP-dependent rRNA helicase spb4 n=1 Tax=Clarias magur TaxID=1594786 RepID=A0A8J4UVP6_CLAMG|nr:ATP-dependent rRNA helicase spb4 [Clarias magur]